jgi:hypothetical protein
MEGLPDEAVCARSVENPYMHFSAASSTFGTSCHWIVRQ